ncbi:hypothetical protein BofuT4_P007460.1 [Botrytis cinerea T4]|uniref:Uncharacterized protein n=1 Tax=Botryotinia fuckeliana (strain T4) TaxID=999810 RepID=G2XXJ0_BOTF4|nr:hypothetical protein BofuT4_P007460.1 [Botrytis cinerea T4]
MQFLNQKLDSAPKCAERGSFPGVILRVENWLFVSIDRQTDGWCQSFSVEILE